MHCGFATSVEAMKIAMMPGGPDDDGPIRVRHDAPVDCSWKVAGLSILDPSLWAISE
jgi:hypothetical protein